MIQHERIFLYDFAEPLGINSDGWKVFCIGINFLFKSNLVDCALPLSKLHIGQYNYPSHRQKGQKKVVKLIYFAEADFVRPHMLLIT